MLSSLSNGLRVLEFIVDRGEAGVSEVARELDLTVGTAHRLVATLVGAGFVEQNPSNRRYRPSGKIPELARRVEGEVDFVATAHGHLERLQARTGETMNLGVLRDNRVVYIDRAVSDQPLAVSVRVGSRVPAYCTALGKALLAFGSDEQRERYISDLKDIAAGETQPPPSKRSLKLMLADVASEGFASDDGEFAADIACFAAPVLDRRGHAVAAVSVSGPRSRMRERRSDFIDLIVEASKELSETFQSVGGEDL